MNSKVPTKSSKFESRRYSVLSHLEHSLGIGRIPDVVSCTPVSMTSLRDKLVVLHLLRSVMTLFDWLGCLDQVCISLHSEGVI